MHIVIVSDAELGGGAAICAARLAAALVRKGRRVTRLVRVASGEGHPWTTRVFGEPGPAGLARRVGRKLGWIDEAATRVRQTNRQLTKELEALRPDIINLHNLHWDLGTGWTPALAEICQGQAPTVWTLHDMWSFTGRCAYSWACRKYLTGCDATCPTPTEYPALEPARIAGAWRQRTDLLQRCTRLRAITPSRWLAAEAQAGLWRARQVDVIPNGLPLEVYKPLDKQMARAALEIATHGPVLLVSGNKVSEPMFAALRGASWPAATLLVMGRGVVPALGPRIRVQRLGYIDQERMKVLAYNAADMFIHYASMDNLPNVVMESIACGTPVVGAPGGGVPEMVREGVTGWLSREVTVASYQETLARAANDWARGVDLRGSCRAVAENEYAEARQAQRYGTLFEEMHRLTGR